MHNKKLITFIVNSTKNDTTVFKIKFEKKRKKQTVSNKSFVTYSV